MMTWPIATSSADIARYRPASERLCTSSATAPCTGLRASTTPSADTSANRHPAISGRRRSCTSDLLPPDRARAGGGLAVAGRRAGDAGLVLGQAADRAAQRLDVGVVLAPRGELLGREQHRLRVDEALARVVRELVLGAGPDRLDRARLLAEAAEDAPQHVDLEVLRVALAERDRVLRVVLLRPDVDRLRRARRGAQVAADAALEAVLVAVQPVPAL